VLDFLAFHRENNSFLRVDFFAWRNDSPTNMRAVSLNLPSSPLSHPFPSAAALFPLIKKKDDAQNYIASSSRTRAAKRRPVIVLLPS
jgi:hypothetical protein